MRNTVGQAAKRWVGVCLSLVGLVGGASAAMTATASADHEPGHVAVLPLEGSELNKCQGAMPTPGSENTDKRLVGGTLVPGGTAIFEFVYPFDPTDDNGRQDFVILDCVFVDDEPALAFELRGVPNDVNPFVFQFTVDIPTDIAVGAEFCNVGKTTAAPSSAQASNRKAGPACFVVGGGLRVVKVDPAGLPLTGATFEVVCTPSSQLLPVVIEGVTGASYTGTTGTDNALSIAGPLGTVCVITETVPPPGYVLATPASVTATISELAGADIVFTNPPAVGDLAITKVSDTPGTFSFTVNCPGTAVADRVVTVTVTGAGAPGATSAPITAIPTGSVCTVTESVPAGFAPQAPRSVTISAGTTTVTFTNVRLTGTLVVAKTTLGGTGTFDFTVDCTPGTSFDSAFSLTGTETRRIAGIPTGTSCVVAESPTPAFASVVSPAGGTVVIAEGDNVVSVTNTLRPPVLAIAKTADAPAVTSGAGVGFTVTVTNAGPTPATGVSLNDPLPTAPGISWAVSPAHAGPGTCSVTGSAPVQTLACSFGDLAPGAGVRVHVAGATTAATAGTLTNTATARAANHGPVSATATVVVIPPAVVAPVTPAATPAPSAVAPVTPAATPAQAVVLGTQLARPEPAPAPEVPGGTLPRTGAGTAVPMTLTGLALVALGSAMRRWSSVRPARVAARHRRRR